MGSYASVTFYCDTKGCRALFTAHGEKGAVGPYLELTEAGWRVKRPLVGSWKHYCPEHAPEAAA